MQETEIRHLHDIRKPLYCIILAKIYCLLLKVNGMMMLSKWIEKTIDLFIPVHWDMDVQAEIIHMNCFPKKYIGSK